MKKTLLPAPTLLAYDEFLKSVFFPRSPPGFFDGQYPILISSDVNFVVIELILWREVTKRKDSFFRILKYFNRFQNILCMRF